jgi:hypothetical protein
MMIGGFICLVGLALTLLTLAASEVTGFYLFAWGAIVFGAAQFVRGVLQLRNERRLAGSARNAAPGTSSGSNAGGEKRGRD